MLGLIIGLSIYSAVLGFIIGLSIYSVVLGLMIGLSIYSLKVTTPKASTVSTSELRNYKPTWFAVPASVCR